MPSWVEYITYLEKFIIEDSQVQSFSGQKFVLTDFGKSRYITSNQQELEEALTDLHTSNENNFEL